jgi:hypothetical protein
MSVSPTVRCRLEAQGFCGLDDKTLAELAPWMRWTYTLGTLVTLIGVPLILLGGLASTTNFCIPSFIYNTVVGRAGRRHQESVQ